MMFYYGDLAYQFICPLEFTALATLGEDQFLKQFIRTALNHVAPAGGALNQSPTSIVSEVELRTLFSHLIFYVGFPRSLNVCSRIISYCFSLIQFQ